MANWVKGKLKIRGKPEDIKRWVRMPALLLHKVV